MVNYSYDVPGYHFGFLVNDYEDVREKSSIDNWNDSTEYNRIGPIGFQRFIPFERFDGLLLSEIGDMCKEFNLVFVCYTYSGTKELTEQMENIGYFRIYSNILFHSLIKDKNGFKIIDDESNNVPNYTIDEVLEKLLIQNADERIAKCFMQRYRNHYGTQNSYGDINGINSHYKTLKLTRGER